MVVVVECKEDGGRKDGNEKFSSVKRKRGRRDKAEIFLSKSRVKAEI